MSEAIEERRYVEVEPEVARVAIAINRESALLDAVVSELEGINDSMMP